MVHVAILEDESDIREITNSFLEEHGVQVSEYESIEKFCTHVKNDQADFNFAIIDLGLDGRNSGFEAIRAMRDSSSFNKTPVIILTGNMTEESVKKAFSLGVDDYITKPFRADILLGKIAALAKRVGLNKKAVLQFGSMVLNSAAHTLKIDNKEVPLTVTEFKMLKALMTKVDQVMGREEFKKKVFGTDNITARTIDVHVCALRKKMGEHGYRLKTVRGIGYRFDGV